MNSTVSSEASCMGGKKLRCQRLTCGWAESIDGWQTGNIIIAKLLSTFLFVILEQIHIFDNETCVNIIDSKNVQG